MSDLENDDDGINVIIDYTQKVKITRFLGNELQPVQLTIKAEVLPNSSEELDFDVAFTKIKFWFETVVSRCVVCSRTNALALGMLIGEDGPRLANHLMITPYEPRDEHLGVLFQSKMTALAANSFNFGCVKVGSDMSGGLVFTYVGEWEKDLPDMEEWFNSKPYYFEEPWWCRDDASILDIKIGDDIDVDSVPSWAFKLDFLEKTMRPKPKKEENAKQDQPHEEVVIKFKPKIIDCGKDEAE